MNFFSTEDLLFLLYQTDIFGALYQNRLNLSQTILLNNSDVRNVFCRRLGLPLSSHLAQFRIDYNRKYYTQDCHLYLSPYQSFNLAARYGEIEVVKKYNESRLFIEVKDAFIEAAKGGHHEIIDYLYSRIHFADVSSARKMALKAAVAADNIDMFNHLRSFNRYDILNDIQLREFLIHAANNNAPRFAQHIMEILTEKNEDSSSSFNRIRIRLAIFANDISTLKELIPTIRPHDFLDIYRIVVVNNNPEIMEYCLNLIRKNTFLPPFAVDIAHRGVIWGAIQSGNFELLDKYHHVVRNNLRIVSRGLEDLIENNQRDFIQILIPKIRNICKFHDYTFRGLMDLALIQAIYVNNFELIEYFIQLGASDWVKFRAEARNREDTQYLIPIFDRLSKTSKQ